MKYAVFVLLAISSFFCGSAYWQLCSSCFVVLLCLVSACIRIPANRGAFKNWEIICGLVPSLWDNQLWVQSYNLQTKQINNDTAVDQEIVHGFCCFSAALPKSQGLLDHYQKRFYIAFPAMCHACVACTNHAKFEALVFPGWHNARKSLRKTASTLLTSTTPCCQLPYKKRPTHSPN